MGLGPAGAGRPRRPRRSRARSRSPEIRAPTVRSAVVSSAARTTGSGVSRAARAAIAGASDAASRSSSGLAAGASASRPMLFGTAARSAGSRHAGASTTGARSSGAPSSTARRSVRPDGVGERVEAQPGELAPDILGEGREEGDDLFRGPRELRPQVLALGGDPRGARVEVTLAGHVAADRDEGRGAEAVLLGPEEGGHHDVTTRLEPAVRPQDDAVAKALADEDLVGLGEAELPRRADRLDRRERAGARASGVAGHEDVVRVGLRDARRDRPDARRGDELDADPGPGVDRPQVGDELGEVLDRVDVVMRRRADVGHPDLAAPEGGDERRRLPGRQLAALAGLAPLGHLDLELLGPGQVARRDAEARRGDLLDRRFGELAGLVGLVGGRVLAALAGVRGRPQAPHPDRQRPVRLGREGAEAHRRGDEAPHDLRGWLDGCQRHRARPPQRQQVADHRRLVADHGRPVGDQLLLDRSPARRPARAPRRVRRRPDGRPQAPASPWPRPARRRGAPRRRGTGRIPGRRERAPQARPGRPRAWRARASAPRRSKRGGAGRSRRGREAASATSSARPMTSKSWPPRYEASVLIPIRASTLRRPCSSAVEQARLGRIRLRAPPAHASRRSRGPGRSRARGAPRRRRPRGASRRRGRRRRRRPRPGGRRRPAVRRRRRRR